MVVSIVVVAAAAAAAVAIIIVVTVYDTKMTVEMCVFKSAFRSVDGKHIIEPSEWDCSIFENRKMINLNMSVQL